MRRLYLHVGLHKTGTSFLQRLALENRALLAEAGLGLGPFQDASGSHHPIVEAIDRDGPEAVLDRVAEAQGQRLMISAEELSSRLLEPSYAAALAAAAARHFEPHLVIFLRRQDFLKESAFAEIVKDWYWGDIRDDDHYHLDHAGRVAALEAAFGRGRVRVALYRDPGPNDIVADLLALTGTAVDRSRGSAVAPRFLARVVADSDAIADDGGRFLMSPSERHALVAAHLDGNRALTDRLGIADPGPFLELPDPDAPWTPPAPIAPREVAAVRRAALAACLRGRNPVAAARLAAQVARLLAPMAGRPVGPHAADPVG